MNTIYESHQLRDSKCHTNIKQKVTSRHIVKLVKSKDKEKILSSQRKIMYFIQQNNDVNHVWLLIRNNGGQKTVAYFTAESMTHVPVIL